MLNGFRGVQCLVFGVQLTVFCWQIVGSAVGQAQTPISGASGTVLGQQIEALVGAPGVSRAHWGVMVEGMDGVPLYGLNSGQLFQPASNAKLFTTAAAMALLGPEKRFETRVVARGSISSKGELDGELLLVGGGDANLSGRTVPYVAPPPAGASGQAPVQEEAEEPKVDPLRYLEAMADEVVKRGIKIVRGDVVGDDTLFPWEPYGSDWAIEDAVWGYGAPVSALTINDNEVRLSVAPASAAGESATATMEPALPYYTVDLNVTTAGAKDGSLVWVDRGMGSKVVRAYGRVALGGAADISGLAIDDPARYGAMAFKALLQERGVEVTGVARASHREAEAMRPYLQVVREPYPAVAGGAAAGCLGCPWRLAAGERVLASHMSPPLGEDVVVTNKVSQNLHAELMLHAMGLLRGDGSTAQGARAVRQFLLGAGVDGDDFVFFDGSGLSGHDLVTPRAVVRLLEYAAGQPWFPAWKASLPVGGVDGSLHGRFTQGPLVGKVFAKTGTLGEARALSGYVECASGRTVAFSVLVGGYVPGGRVVQGVIDSIVVAIAANE